jgi:ribose transport system substrate-binding protein
MIHRRVPIIIVFAVYLLIGVYLVGCNSAPATPAEVESPPNETVRIALLLPESVPFFATLRQGAEEAATRLNVELLVEDAGNDIVRQNEQIEAMTAAGVAAIIITPVDVTAVTEKLAAAANAGIAILTVDRSIESDVVIAHIASDNVAGGRMAADYLAETIGKAGTVVELEGIAGTSAAQERGAGFNEALTAYPNITVVAREVANFNRAEGETVFAAILAGQPDITAVFAHNDEMILGAILAAQAAGRAGDITFVGFDAVDDAIAALEEGNLAATIAQQPAEMGRLGLEYAVKHLQGETIPANVAVDLALITR